MSTPLNAYPHMLCRFIANNITRPFIAGFSATNSGRGIADFTVSDATRPSASVNGNALMEDPALSVLRSIVLRTAAVYGNDSSIQQMASSVLDLVSASPHDGQIFSQAHYCLWCACTH